jgi:tRNA(Ile)-lysidine synthase
MAPEPASLFAGLDLARRASVVAAVSGGGDSLALLLQLKSFLDRHAQHVRLLAVTVDHRLRAEAAGEAQDVARLCDRHGIAHRTLAWEGAKPSTGVIAAARDARHRLLAHAAREVGTDLVLTGHTQDDQAETIAMRGERQADGEGMSGIAPATLYEGSTWFCRPLLGIRRAALRAYLVRLGIVWADDPSNDDPTFERARVRAALGESQITELAAAAAANGRQRLAFAGEAGRLIRAFASRPQAGLFRVDAGMFGPLAASHRPGDAAATRQVFSDRAVVLAMRALLATIGGSEHLPDRERVEALVERIALETFRATLSRTVVDARPGGVWIRREARGLPTADLSCEPVRWDGRWTLSVDSGRSGVIAGPIGRGEDPEPAAGLPPGLVRAALSTEPGVFADGCLVGHADGKAARSMGVSAAAIVAPHAVYLPSFDVELAAALRALLALPPLPRAPWNHHIDARA